jgi:hypothetical protein
MSFVPSAVSFFEEEVSLAFVLENTFSVGSASGPLHEIKEQT